MVRQRQQVLQVLRRLCALVGDLVPMLRPADQGKAEACETLNKKDQINQIKARLAKLYKSRCYVCHCKKSKSGMTFHHLWYLPGELTYSDFHDKLVYYQELENLVRQNPKRFLYVCSDHHQAIERNVRWGDTNFKRLIRAVRMTKKAKAQHFITGII